MRYAWTLLLSIVACGPLPPTPDAGAPVDAGAKETSTQPCIGDYGGCTPGVSTCCTPGYACNTSTNVCQQPCITINGLCSDSSQCCSGICNGTCQ